MTTLTRLRDKGLVARRKAGRGFAYEPVVEEADFAAERMRRTLERGHDHAAVLRRFLEGLSSTDAEMLHSLMADARVPNEEAEPGGGARGGGGETGA